jgi:hypothetical protein
MIERACLTEQAVMEEGEIPMLGRLCAGIALTALPALLVISPAEAQQNLTCDLTFGDTQTNSAQQGRMDIRLTGGAVEGEVSASGRSLPVTGYWGQNSVDLTIGGNSYDGYLHLTLEDNEVAYRLAGRFGPGWRGVWHGDCRPAAEPLGINYDAAGRRLIASGDLEWPRGRYLDLETGTVGPASEAVDLIYDAGVLPAIGTVLAARFTRIAGGAVGSRAFDRLLAERCEAAIDGMRQESVRVHTLTEGDLFCALTGESRLSMFLVTGTPPAAGMPIQLRYATWEGEYN